MPNEAQLAHRVVSAPGSLPYISNVSPTVTDPYYTVGSIDLMTSINGYAERRPGFGTNVETTPTTFHNLQRLFTWDRFDGSFYVMACDINASNQPQVYKYLVGTDASFISIFTGIAGQQAFDFVTSNNTLYFGNGVGMKKWDPVNGVTNWGIAIGATSSAVSAYAGTGASVTLTGNAWTNPGNATGPPDGVYATATANTDYLSITNYGFPTSPADTITGISVAITCHASVFGVELSAILTFGGAPIGTAKVNFTSIGTSDLTFPAGSSSDLWGTGGLSPATVNDPSFGVYVYFERGGFGGGTVSVDAVQITVSFTGPPLATVSGSSGTMSATVGYQYVYCYGNSNTGHVSSPTAPSNSTGVFTSKLNVGVTVTASTDPQVNQIRVFRTTDSATGLGGQSYFEIPTSPYPNTSTTITDSAADTALNIYSIAPVPTFNDPPPGTLGFVYFAGRIWMFTGNKVWFTGLEEITIGVPEESVPSGVAGNFWSFDQPVQGLGVSGINNNQTLLIFCGGRIYGITGNTLDTFQRFQISNRRGARNRTCITMMGGMCAWLDSANQIWATNGTDLEELSVPIRPDLTGITQANCSMSFHVAGRFNWLIFNTGAKTFVYDIDQEQWMPPWSFGCQYLFSGETSPGAYQLMASIGTKAIQISPSAHNDNGNSYQPIANTNLFSVVPDFGQRFSYIAAGSYNEPTRTGCPFYFQVDTNNFSLSDVGFEADDDPTTATYTSIFLQKKPVETTFMRRNGTNINQQIFPMSQPMSRWVSFRVTMANADQADKIFGWHIAYESKR